MKKLVYFLPITLFIVLGIFLFRGISLDPSALPSALIDKPVPVFSLVDLQDGKLQSEKIVQGQVTLLNVWATWCVSCRMEHPYLIALAKQGVRIIGVDYKDDDAKASAWLTELGNPYAITVVDTQGSLGLDLGVYGAPETFLVDKQGIIRYKRVGVIDERVWQKEILPLYTKLSQP